MRLALFLPDGVGLRNFVLSGFLEEVARHGEVEIISHAPDTWIRSEVPNPPPGVTWSAPVQVADGARARFLRQGLLYAHMQWAGTVSMRFNLQRPLRGSWRNRWFHRAARRLGARSASPSGIQSLEGALLRVVRKGPAYRAYHERFQRRRPDLLFVTNQKAPTMIPAVLAARDLGIPTSTFVFSWDNLTSKGRIAVPFDHYLVWSDLMGEELRRYYPEVTPDQVHVVGTPQFAPYADPSLREDRRDFLTRIGADPDRPLVCYSTAAADTVPEEPLHVRALLDLVCSGRIPRNPQVLVRPSPTDAREGRWTNLRQDHPELLFRVPDWRAYGGAWTQVLPTRADVRFLANLAAHSDVNVNIASTMTLDFAICGKPIVNVAFDVVSPPTFGVPLTEYYYRFDHYQPVLELGAVRVARTPEELAVHLNAYLADETQDAEARRRLVRLQVGVFPTQINRSVARALVQAVD